MWSPENLTQAINPWSWLFKTDNTNTLLSINNHYKGDPKVEAAVTSEVAGYGKQLGKIEDALSVLLKKMTQAQEASLSAEEKAKISEYHQMVREIEMKKRDMALSKFSPGGVADLVSELQALKRNNPAEFKQIAETLKKALV